MRVPRWRDIGVFPGGVLDRHGPPVCACDLPSLEPSGSLGVLVCGNPGCKRPPVDTLRPERASS